MLDKRKTDGNPSVFYDSSLPNKLLMNTFAPAIDFDGGKYGIGLLAKKTPIRVERMALPGREEARAMILVEFDTLVGGIKLAHI